VGNLSSVLTVNNAVERTGMLKPKLCSL